MKEAEEAKITDDTEIVLEIDHYCKLFEIVSVLQESGVEGITDKYILTEAEGKIVLKDKNKKITLFYRDKHSGRGGADLNHANSLKIDSPSFYKGMEIIIPSEDETEAKIKNGSKKFSDTEAKRNLKRAFEFAEKNARFLNAFFKSDNEKVKKRAVYQLQSHNDDIIDIDVTGLKDDDIINDKLQDRLKGKN